MRTKTIFIVAIVCTLVLMGNMQLTPTPTADVTSVNTFLNIGQFGALLYLLWRSDNALMRQRAESASERWKLIDLLVSEREKNRTRDE